VATLPRVAGIRIDLEQAARRGVTVEKLDATGANLTGARLSGLKADFVVFDLADLTGALVRTAGLTDCDFVEATLVEASFTSATLWQCRFHGAVADGIDLAHATVSICWLRSARLVGARLYGATLEHCDLSGSDLRRADLTRMRAPKVDLRGADLREADLTRADLTGADLRGARLDGAVFADAVLTDAMFDGPPPDTSTRAYTWDGVVAVLDRRDSAAARQWWRDRPAGHDVWEYFNLSGRMHPTTVTERFGRAPVLALFAEILTCDDQIALYHALQETHHLHDEGWDVTEILPALPGLLDRPRGPVIPGTGGRARTTADPGRRAAQLLGALAYHPAAGEAPDTARSALRAALTGGANSQRNAAFALAYAAVLHDDWAEVDPLVAAGPPRIRAATCQAFAEIADGAYHRPPVDAAWPHRVEERLTRLSADPVRTVSTAATAARKPLHRARQSHDNRVRHGHVTCPDCTLP
jgi:uncharacterized protein YjbI with pentapeptide repeats